MLQTLREIFDPLFSLLGGMLFTFHGWGAPWWLAIAMLTVVVRAVLFPLTFRQVKSMRRMQELKPEIDEIRRRHKDDPQRQQQEMMKLYGERNINPLGGCLPALVQLPIFLVLYYTIKEFEHLESFRTGGLLWFDDLTAYDPYFALPVVYVLTLMAAQEITIRNTNPQQRQLMRALPVVFGVVLARFPAGLFVYYITSNLISVLQNLLIYRLHPPAAPEPAAQAQEERKPSDRRRRRRRRAKSKKGR
ncbi:60 kDa inner membrane insertion protein [Rubrobacter xylanophilus DSM 9941]|uniref:Membrane protein insertase YidC n=1 Tax=Rubrobacter xylanophilus (strain DSM 9941 / JCM 11954 / NBRC 16129 / PRD-1) TaxID=266117 RepID=Q1ATM7_RUBXD|nr:membrane protein insertase YidC [Rubrobacter xylanophilus]ABG05251.1 60 kDa inner membrane insertion protein [Rubrobacter xylanophilus DSM 9941]